LKRYFSNSKPQQMDKILRFSCFFIISNLFLAFSAQAQVAVNGLYKSNTYVCEVENLDMPDGKLPLGSFMLISGDNMTGFNNNPAWSVKHDDMLYLAVSRDNKTSDIVEYDLDKRVRRQVTFTEDENELMARPMYDYAHCAALTVERSKIMRLHKFRIDTLNEPKIFAGDMDQATNYLFMNLYGMAVYLADNKNVAYLDFTPENGNEAVKVERVSAQCASNLQINTRGDLYFVYKKSEGEWQIKIYDRKTGKNRTVCSTLQPGIENFTVLPDNSLICAKGSIIYRLFPDRAPVWQVAADLQDAGIFRITQLVCNKKGKIAIVTE
jgi:hypothetical protein